MGTVFCLHTVKCQKQLIWSVLENLGVETLAIKFDLKMRLFKSPAGLGRLRFIGVVPKHSIAKLGSLPACLALIRALLIVWICLPIKPFDFGNFGDDVMWSNCHCWANSLNVSLEYCGPLSLTRFSWHIEQFLIMFSISALIRSRYTASLAWRRVFSTLWWLQCSWSKIIFCWVSGIIILKPFMMIPSLTDSSCMASMTVLPVVKS